MNKCTNLIIHHCVHLLKTFDFRFNLIENLLGFKSGCFLVLNIKSQTNVFFCHLPFFPSQALDDVICYFQQMIKHCLQSFYSTQFCWQHTIWTSNIVYMPMSHKLCLYQNISVRLARTKPPFSSLNLHSILKVQGYLMYLISFLLIPSKPYFLQCMQQLHAS